MSSDPKYLLDIQIAANKVLQFTNGIAWEEFQQNELLHFAVVKLIEIMGEASSKITQATRDAHPEIPWRDIIGMRNRLIHEYFRIDLETVWDVVENDIPRLLPLVEPLVPHEEDV